MAEHDLLTKRDAINITLNGIAELLDCHQADCEDYLFDRGFEDRLADDEYELCRDALEAEVEGLLESIKKLVRQWKIDTED